MSGIRALVRRPSPRLADGLVTHLTRKPVDAGLALRQWHGYVDMLSHNGVEVTEVEPADDCPDAVFVEDTVVVCDDLAVITRPGALERRAETVGTRAALAAAGYRIAEMSAPATLDGGDVLKVGGTVYVGVTTRTNPQGVQQLRDLLGPLDKKVVEVVVNKALHLKSAVTALPDGTIIGYLPIIDDPSVFPSFHAVPEEGGSHVVLLGDDRVLMASSAPRAAKEFEAMGLRPQIVNISEFEKMEGCVTCLSVRLRRAISAP
jgi:dimethylargininase